MYVIAGPCSAESLQQVLETASALKEVGIDCFRAGVWKPRTRPGCFEGHGAVALPWLQRVQQDFGMKVCCEVANATHVEECLKAGIDMLWIGARSTSNPFVVQEIADALRGVDEPVLVKNPINPDMGLWVGAFERLSRCGVKNFAAVHRGVSTSQPKKYRNDPAWDMPVKLRGVFPELNIYCDPSHMGGSYSYVRELSQRALDLGLDGLMIEVHSCPECALSDAGQQLTPSALEEMLGQLVVRAKDSTDRSYLENIEMLRARLDTLDENIITLLGSRMDVSRNIGKFKRDNNIAIFQPRRWDAELARMIELGRNCGLSEEFIRTFFSVIHSESMEVQK